MWSLPVIKDMNARKIQELKERKAAEKVCTDCEKKATKVFEYYDIYSDTPMYVDYCEEHYENFYDNGAEGFFYCDECDRMFMTNITWENHYVSTDEATYCLNCYTRKVFENPLSYSDIESLDFERLQQAPHIIGVDNDNMEEEIAKQGWKRLGDVTADSMTGGLVVGFSESTSREDTLEGLKEHIKKNGFTEFIIGVDGAYQFAVRIAVYAR